MSRSSHLVSYEAYPETPVCIVVSITWDASFGESNSIHD